MHLHIPGPDDPNVPFTGRAPVSHFDGHADTQSDPVVGFFYDIDGCLHKHGIARRDDENRLIHTGKEGFFVWAPYLEVVLAEFPELQVFSHSNWRNYCTLAELKALLPPALSARTIGVTEPRRDRHKSIVECAAAAGITHYVILDDDPWEFPVRLADLVIVPSDEGLSQSGAVGRLRQAIKDVIARARVASGT